MGPLRLSYSVKELLRQIIAATYSAKELRTFLQLCHALALPLVRKRVRSGKLNLTSLGISESELVYDCLAELFERGDDGRSFVRLRQYLLEQNPLLPADSDEAVLAKLQQIVFIRTHHGLVRVHAELDPVLERILRSLKRYANQGGLVTIERRLGEEMLVVSEDDPAWHRPPMPMEVFRRTMAFVVRPSDSVRGMAEKLYGTLRAQDEYQRAVGFLNCALLFKELSEVSWQAEREFEQSREEAEGFDDIGRTVRDVCSELADQMRPTYVGRGKRTEQEFQAYVQTVQKVLEVEYVAGYGSSPTFHQELQHHLGTHPVDEYRARHRKVLEYISKIAKRRLVERLRAMRSADDRGGAYS